jgi:hypothetical protein
MKNIGNVRIPTNEAIIIAQWMLRKWIVRYPIIGAAA